MPVGECSACARLEILFAMRRNAFATNRYCRIDDTWSEFGSVGNLSGIVLFQPCFQVFCHTDIMMRVGCHV